MATKTKSLIIEMPIFGQPDWNQYDYILFCSNSHIYKCKSNGDSLKQLTFIDKNYYPSWAPDGTSILFINESSEHFKNYCEMNAIGGGFVILDSLVYAMRPSQWSPDGTKVLFTTASNSSKYRLSYFQFNPSKEVVSLESLFPDSVEIIPETLNWYADSKTILFSSNYGITSLNIETGAMKIIKQNCPYKYSYHAILADENSIVTNRIIATYYEETNTIFRDWDLLKIIEDGSEEIIPY